MDESDATVLATAALKDWPIVQGAPQLVMHRENTVFRVATSRGDHALRLHRHGYHSERTILSELNWMEMLAGQGFVVPAPAATGAGDFLVPIKHTDGSTHLFSLLSWLPGEPFGKSASPLRFKGQERYDVMAEIGRNLARLHLLSDQWMPPADFTRPRWDNAGLLGDTPFWGQFWQSAFLTPADRIELTRIRSFCVEALTSHDRVGADFGLIHADLARENILVNGSSVSFIDFDDSGYGYRMFDIATALIKNIHEPDYDDLQQSLLAAYQAERPLKPEDRARLPLMMLLRSLTYLGWVDARISEPGMVAKAERFLADVKHLARSQWPQGWFAS